MSGTKATFLYFAYGSNLLTKRIHFQNPSAVFKDVAKLEGHKLEFRLPSKRWGGCAATIIKSSQDHLYGCLWELDMENLETLDNQEGVHNGIYAHCDEKVFGVTTNEAHEVYTYQVREEKKRPLSEDCRPSKVYKGVIVQGALEHSLPTEYIDKRKKGVSLDCSGYWYTRLTLDSLRSSWLFTAAVPDVDGKQPFLRHTFACLLLPFAGTAVSPQDPYQPNAFQALWPPRIWNN